MENTSPKKLRAKLKDFLDLAKKEAVRIKRKSGQHFILVSEKKYNELKTELTSLQKSLLKKVHTGDKIKNKANGKVKHKSSDRKGKMIMA
jgi:PHD/YefM family antitoxin component YafN of YafNO toxin-antitoxin module